MHTTGMVAPNENVNKTKLKVIKSEKMKKYK